MSFLPENYAPPAPSGRYYKLQQGENRFRVLGPAVVGNQYWTEKDGKRQPVRRRPSERITTDELEGGSGEPPKHFWAFPVWDYSDSQVKVMEITQKGIQKEIAALVRDEDWGDPKGYDISVSRDGEGMDTSYAVKPKPAKPLTPQQEEGWKEARKEGFDLDELFSGGDPFQAGIGIEDATVPE